MMRIFVTGDNHIGLNTMYELAHGYFDAAFLKARLDPLLEKKHQNTPYDYYANINSVWAKMEQRTNKQSKM